MTEQSWNYDTARAYTDGVRDLFAPPRAVKCGVVERDASGVVTANYLANHAETLLPLSAAFTREVAAQLEVPDPAVRVGAAAQLLTKALTDLQISAQMLQTAMDEADSIPESHDDQVERSLNLAVPPDLEENLRFLSGAPQAALAPAERAVNVLPADVATARVQLVQMVDDTIDLIFERADKTGQEAISGLLVLGVSEVANAATFVGLEISESLGVTEKLTRFCRLFRDFLLSAWNSLAALLGPEVAKNAAQQVLAWVKDITNGEQFTKLLEMFYETHTTEQSLASEISVSQADLERFVAAIQEVDSLGGKFSKQVVTIEKLLKGLRLFGAIPASMVPQAKLLMASLHILLGGYVILAGAEFVDAKKLRWLDRFPGVRDAVECHLSAA